MPSKPKDYQKIRQDSVNRAEAHSLADQWLAANSPTSAASNAPRPQKREDVSAPPAPEKDARLNPDGIVDIVTFCEHKYFLGLKLTPWQRIMLKSFYMGVQGNSHLAIQDIPEEKRNAKSCDGCVWDYVKESEVKHTESRKTGGRVIPLVMVSPENSPCLTCTRFDPKIREERYVEEHENALNEAAEDDIVKWEARELADEFKTERDLFNDPALNRRSVNDLIKKLEKPRPYQQLVLVLGRRSGKSFLVSVIALYEVYRFLMMGHPQLRFPLMEFDVITICNVALSEKQAKEAIFDKIRQLVFASPYFAKYVGKENQLEIIFRTPRDLEENERRKGQGLPEMDGTIQLMSGHSNSTTLVGRTMAVIIIDEMAEMGLRGASEDGLSADYRLYTKLKPSLRTFGPHGKIICISNPLGPSGQFYDLYKLALEEPSMLMIQLPSWLSNPNIDRGELRTDERLDPVNFQMQYAAEFSDITAEPFVPSEYIAMAFDAGYKEIRSEFGQPLVRYYAHLDPSKSSDYYTLCICHCEPIEGKIGPDRKPLQKVIVDHLHLWRPKGKNHPINADEVDEYIIKLSGKFHMTQVSYDHIDPQQHAVVKLRAHGINAIQKSFNRQYKEKIYDELYQLFTSGRIEFYGENTMVNAKDGGRESLKEVDECRRQFEQLQKTWRENRYTIQAKPPFKDDFPDCIAAAAYEALSAKTYMPLPRSMAVYLGGRIR